MGEANSHRPRDFRIKVVISYFNSNYKNPKLRGNFSQKFSNKSYLSISIFILFLSIVRKKSNIFRHSKEFMFYNEKRSKRKVYRLLS